MTDILRRVVETHRGAFKRVGEWAECVACALVPMQPSYRKCLIPVKSQRRGVAYNKRTRRY